MTRADDAVRLRHMQDAANKALAFAQGRKRADLDADEMFALALVRLLEVIGEAAKGVSAAFRDRHDDVSWKVIGGMRDRLIHGYFDVDLDVVWSVVNSDLPVLIGQLDAMHAEDREADP